MCIFAGIVLNLKISMSSSFVNEDWLRYVFGIGLYGNGTNHISYQAPVGALELVRLIGQIIVR